MKTTWYIIDGYSLLYRSQPEGFANREAMARGRKDLVDHLSGLLPCERTRVTIVFDGQSASDGLADHGGAVEIKYTHGGQSADAYIEQLASRLVNPSQVMVVSSDRAVVEFSAAAGCQVMTARTLLEQLDREQKRHRRQVKQIQRSPRRGAKLGDFFPDQS